MKVVAIGAHPDDVEIGAGGSAALHRARDHEVHFVLLSSGEALSDAGQREQEARRAADILDVDRIHVLDYVDTEIPYDGDIVKRLDDLLTTVGADRVYVHAEMDTHQDHRRAALASIAASRNVDEVLSFESPSTRSSFTPQYYRPLPEDVLEQKIASIQAHESQCEKDYLESEAMRGLARFRGRQANSRYAEAFQVIRIAEHHEPHAGSE